MLNRNERHNSGPSTIIGTTVTLIGVLRDQQDLTIHGTVEGEVHSERSVTIGESAIIKGPITADVISVAGTIRGSLEATTRLEILSTGKVYGSITTSNLVIQSGAIFIGKCAMPQSEAKGESETEQPSYEVE